MAARNQGKADAPVEAVDWRDKSKSNEKSEKSLREEKRIGGNIDCSWSKQEIARKSDRFARVGKKSKTREGLDLSYYRYPRLESPFTVEGMVVTEIEEKENGGTGLCAGDVYRGLLTDKKWSTIDAILFEVAEMEGERRGSEMATVGLYDVKVTGNLACEKFEDCALTGKTRLMVGVLKKLERESDILEILKWKESRGNMTKVEEIREFLLGYFLKQIDDDINDVSCTADDVINSGMCCAADGVINSQMYWVVRHF